MCATSRRCVSQRIIKTVLLWWPGGAVGSEKEISVGCLVEDNSTAASFPNPPLTLRSGLPQSRHMYSFFLPSPEAHVAGASENLFPETFSTMWPLGRRGRQRGSKRYLQPPKPPSELQVLPPEHPHIQFCAAPHVHPIMASATRFQFL